MRSSRRPKLPRCGLPWKTLPVKAPAWATKLNTSRRFTTESKNHNDSAFETLAASLAELVTEAERFGAIVCIEAVAKHVIHTPARMKKMLDTFNRLANTALKGESQLGTMIQLFMGD